MLSLIAKIYYLCRSFSSYFLWAKYFIEPCWSMMVGLVSSSLWTFKTVEKTSSSFLIVYEILKLLEPTNLTFIDLHCHTDTSEEGYDRAVVYLILLKTTQQRPHTYPTKYRQRIFIGITLLLAPHSFCIYMLTKALYALHVQIFTIDI